MAQTLDIRQIGEGLAQTVPGSQEKDAMYLPCSRNRIHRLETTMLDSTTKQALLDCLENYRRSIEGADTIALAEAVWATAPETTLIHPRGHELGWEQIRRNFYEGTMDRLFSSRTLKIVGEPLLHVYGTTAVAEFDWDFVATRRADGTLQHTMGRESQVWMLSAQGRWQLVHVHYSAVPQA